MKRVVVVRTVLDRVIGGATAVLFGLLLAVVLWQVIVRHAPIAIPSRYATWTEELARALLLWLTTIGAAYATGRREHLAMDLFASRMRGPAGRGMDILAQASIAVFGAAVMLVGGGMLVGLTLGLEQVAASLGVPMGLVYLALPLGGAAMMAYAVCNAIEGPLAKPDRSADGSGA